MEGFSIGNRSSSQALCFLLILGMTGCASDSALAQPLPAAVSAFDAYVHAVEERLARQHRSQQGFLALTADGAQNEIRLHRGDLTIEQLTPLGGMELPGALLHHWRGTAFVAGARAADFERMMKKFNDYPQHFSPQVLQAKVLVQQDDRFQALLRVRQKHVLTVVLDTYCDIAFSALDAQHGYSISRSTQIDEIDAPGSPSEHVLASGEQHGFLWRLDTYWTYEERDGGLYMQVESISLTRSIPRGLGWAVGPFVESVPRESLEFTLRATCRALRR